jgi:hypothetical protein
MSALEPDPRQPCICTSSCRPTSATVRWHGPRGNLSFAFDSPLPLALIGRVAAALAAPYAR